MPRNNNEQFIERSTETNEGLTSQNQTINDALVDLTVRRSSHLVGQSYLESREGKTFIEDGQYIQINGMARWIGRIH